MSEQLTVFRVLQDVMVLPVKAMLRLERLWYAAQISQQAPRMLCALMQEAQGQKDEWGSRLLFDAVVLQRAVVDRLGGLPSPSPSPRDWERLWTRHGREWEQILRLFEARLLERVVSGELIIGVLY